MKRLLLMLAACYAFTISFVGLCDMQQGEGVAALGKRDSTDLIIGSTISSWAVSFYSICASFFMYLIFSDVENNRDRFLETGFDDLEFWKRYKDKSAKDAREAVEQYDIIRSRCQIDFEDMEKYAVKLPDGSLQWYYKEKYYTEHANGETILYEEKVANYKKSIIEYDQSIQNAKKFFKRALFFSGASLLSTVLLTRYAKKAEKVYSTIETLVIFTNHEIEVLNQIVAGEADLVQRPFVEFTKHDIADIPYLRHVRAEVYATLSAKAGKKFDEMLCVLQRYIVCLSSYPQVILAMHKESLYKAVTDFLAVLSKEFCWAKSNPGMCQLTDANRAFLAS